ncbi:MAG: redoxin domain-containing protein [Pirellulaceae bacterium]|nr:redoxin domain-containing protein [Pirellulaceae bacterium]
MNCRPCRTPLSLTPLGLAVWALAALAPDTLLAARPTVEQALALAPVQADIEIDVPTKAEAAECQLTAETIDGVSGWVVRSGDGRLLRRFLDSNKDNKVDHWCYFKDGVEIYRDLDTDFDGKADQYRWLGTAGIRWGLDTDQDGTIDRWKLISAEEVTEEAVRALATRDARRFERLLLTSDELDALGLGTEQREALSQRLAAARQQFAALARQQKLVTERSKWIHFGASRPGILPAGSLGAKRDVVVYDNVAAVIETEGKHSQLALGTIVQADGTWRLTSLPSGLQEGQASQPAPGFFFGDGIVPAESAMRQPGGLSAQVQELVGELERIDQRLAASTTAADQARLNSQRADILVKLADAAEGTEEYENWLRQLADTVSAAVQSGQYAGGVERLNKLYEQLETAGKPKELLAYVKFRTLTAEYGQSLQAPNADFAKIQENWLATLEKFVADYPTSADAAEAMLQLAIAQEFAGDEESAGKWYGKIVSDFASSPLAAKATGAKRRLESVGKPVSLSGTSTEGKALSLAAYRGRVVILHYWATWCEPCKQDMQLLKQLQAKYPQAKLALLGVNLDTDAQQLQSFLQTNRLAWPHLREPEGLDGRLANELGVVTLPTMLLIGADGNVLNRSIHAAELETELEKLLR